MGVARGTGWGASSDCRKLLLLPSVVWSSCSPLCMQPAHFIRAHMLLLMLLLHRTASCFAAPALAGGEAVKDLHRIGESAAQDHRSLCGGAWWHAYE